MTQLTPVLAPQQGDVYDHVDMLRRIVLTGTDTGGAFSMVEERAALGAMTPRHLLDPRGVTITGPPPFEPGHPVTNAGTLR